MDPLPLEPAFQQRRIGAFHVAAHELGRQPAGDEDRIDSLRDGAGELLLLGALGGRLDQTLANLLILAQREWPVPVRIAEGGQSAQVLHGGQTLTLTGSTGSTVSLLPLSPKVTGITYTGLEYPLVDATLCLGSTRGISNVLAASPATIRIADGLALVVQGSP